MSSTRTLLLSAAAASLGLAFSLTPATSNATTDSVVHPSSACTWEVDWYAHQPENTVTYFRDGWTHSDMTATHHNVTCGIDRFNITNTNGLRDLDVRLRNGNPEPQLVSCAAVSMRPDGSVVKSTAIYATFVGTHRIDFNGALDQSVAYGAYVLECALPPGVTLVNILQREY